MCSSDLLVRRLLENGSNTSFVNRIVNESEPIDAIIADPVRTVDGYDQVAHPRIPQPLDIYQPERRNSLGVHLANGAVCKAMADRMEQVSRRSWVAAPLIGGDEQIGATDTLRNPANHADVVGSVANATTNHVRAAIDIAVQAQPAWDATPAGVRGDALDTGA